MKDDLKEGKTIIAEYVGQATRNRLVFCHEPIADLVFTDVGRCLSESLSHEDLHSSTIAYAAEDALVELMARELTDATIGQYLALTNIGILFEPELSFNVRNLFERESLGKTLIVCSFGEVKNNRYYFYTEGDGISIDLTGLPFLVM